MSQNNWGYITKTYLYVLRGLKNTANEQSNKAAKYYVVNSITQIVIIVFSSISSALLTSNDNNEVIIQEIADEMVSKIIENAPTPTSTPTAMAMATDGIKVIDTNAPVEVDYSKMQVAMLKKMVAERNLAQGVSKMKKQDLIDVLMNKSQ